MDPITSIEKKKIHLVALFQVDVIGHTHSGCIPRTRGGSAPKITGWYSTVMITSGLSVKLTCSVNVSTKTVNYFNKETLSTSR